MSNATQLAPEILQRLVAIENGFAANAEFSDDLNVRVHMTGDCAWVLLCAASVFFMQAGFALVESGSCRFSSTQSILMKNVMDAVCGTIAWTFVGACLAWGDSASTGGLFGTTGWGDPYGLIPGPQYQFQWSFAAACATIVSGGVAERIPMEGYVIFSMYMTAVIYPVAVCWCWGEDGWLREAGYVDFAGAGVVHLTGGVAGLVGAIMIGPRAGRFGNDRWKFSPHSVPNVMLGTLILWFGWYGFTPGSTGAMGTAADGEAAGKAAICTTFGAGSGALLVYFWTTYIRGQYDICGICNGLLGGLVAVTAGANTSNVLAQLVVGASGGLLVLWVVDLIQWLHIDDPVGAFAVHGIGGLWGLVMAWAFDTTGTVSLSSQLLGAVTLAAWSAANSALIFFLLLRYGTALASTRDQQRGMDAKYRVEAYMSAQGVSRFKAYISHSKDDHGSFARWLHLQLGTFVDGKSRIYFDSDNLVNLDNLMETVREKVDYLIIVHSEDVYWKPWNIGEISQAILNRVPILVVVPSAPRYGKPAGSGAASSGLVNMKSVVAKLPDMYQKNQQEIDELLQPFGIYYKDIEQAYSDLPKAVQVPLDWQSEDQCHKDLLELGNKAELVKTRQAVAMLEKVWDSFTKVLSGDSCAACQEKTKEPPLLLVGDVHDIEALATMQTITFCMTATTRENIEPDQEYLIATPDKMKEVDDFIARGANVLLVLSKDCMRSVLFTRVALHVARSTVKRVVVPIHIEKLGFVFPGEEDYERVIFHFASTLRKGSFGVHGHMDPASDVDDPISPLSNTDRLQVQTLVAFYTFTFRLIALPYSNHASYRTLEQNLVGLKERLHPADPDDESAYWVGPIDKLMSNADRRVERAATSASSPDRTAKAE